MANESTDLNKTTTIQSKLRERIRKPRAVRSRILSFVVYSVLAFCVIYQAGTWYYTHRLYRERPAGVSYATLGDMAEREFRTKHPVLLFISPLIVGATRAALPK